MVYPKITAHSGNSEAKRKKPFKITKYYAGKPHGKVGIRDWGLGREHHALYN